MTSHIAEVLAAVETKLRAHSDIIAAQPIDPVTDRDSALREMAEAAAMLRDALGDAPDAPAQIAA